MTTSTLATISLISTAVIIATYFLYWMVESDDCWQLHSHNYVSPDMNSHLGNEYVDNANQEYYSCLENKHLPVLEKVRFDIDFVNDQSS